MINYLLCWHSASRYTQLLPLLLLSLAPGLPADGLAPSRSAFLSGGSAGVDTSTRTDGVGDGQPWLNTDYGPCITSTLRIDPEHVAKKSIVTRADAGFGGFSEGLDYVAFDTDTLRCVVGWRGAGGIDYRGICFDGDVKQHPSVAGTLLFENADGPGWRLASAPLEADSRMVGRNGEKYGPLDRLDGRWLGHYVAGERVIWSYQVFGTRILESPLAVDSALPMLLVRDFEVGPRSQDLLLQVAFDATANIEMHESNELDMVATLTAPASREGSGDNQDAIAQNRLEDSDDDEDLKEEDLKDGVFEEDEEDDPLYFEWDTCLLIDGKNDFDFTNSDYTIIAELRTEVGGTIFAQVPQDGGYAPNSKSLFVADGRLQFDIGWVDVVQSETEVNDGRWHVVAVTFSKADGEVRLFVDGEEAARGELQPTERVDQDQVLRIGFTTEDFPDEVRGFEGIIPRIAFYQRILAPEEMKQFADAETSDEALVARWSYFDHEEDIFVDESGNEHHARFEEVEIEDDEFDEDDEEYFEEDEEEDRQSLRFDGSSVRVALGNIDDGRAKNLSFTLVARIRTIDGGPIFAISAPDGSWKPNNLCWFVHEGRLAFDLGFVGQVHGRSNIADGQWHDVAMTFDRDTGKVTFLVDGREDGVTPVGEEDEYALVPIDTDDIATTGWIGYASQEFPEEAPQYFSGQIAKLRIYAGVLSAAEVAQVTAMEPAESLGVLAAWVPAFSLDGVVIDHSDNELDGTVQRAANNAYVAKPAFAYTACGVVGAPSGSKWLTQADGHLRLLIPAGEQTLRFSLGYAPTEHPDALDDFPAELANARKAPINLAEMCQGGNIQDSEEIWTESTVIGNEDAPYVVESIAVPSDNPHRSRLQLSGLDFFEDGKSAAVCTLTGDVWKIEGLGDPSNTGFSWRRIAFGLCQPMALKIVKGQIYVTCRDQLALLRDVNGDNIVDFYESFNNDTQVTPTVGAFAIGLEIDRDGHFYYLRGTPTEGDSNAPQHGTLLRVAKDGSQSEIVATGFNSPSGLCINDDGSFFVSDLEGRWTPKNRINYVRAGQFYGNQSVVGGDELADEYQEPLLWLHSAYDQAPADLIRVGSSGYGPLADRLLGLSNSTGAISVFLMGNRENGNQCTVYRMPLTPLPVAPGWGRFSPHDGQLYVCGFIDSASGKVRDHGALYRIRYTGRRATMPVAVSATSDGISIKFNGRLEPESATDWRNYAAARWGYRRTSRFGSEDYRVSDPRRRGRDRLLVSGVELSDDQKTVTARFSDMRKADQMELKCRIKSASGELLNYRFHQTIHHLRDPDSRLSRR